MGAAEESREAAIRRFSVLWFRALFKEAPMSYDLNGINASAYNDYMLPDGIHRRKIGAWGRNGVKVTVRFAL